FRVIGDDGEIERPRLLGAERRVAGRVRDVDRPTLGVAVGVPRAVDGADADGVEGVGGVGVGLAEEGLPQRVVALARRALLGPLERGWRGLGCCQRREEGQGQTENPAGRLHRSSFLGYGVSGGWQYSSAAPVVP